jgi:hypothetical protein
MIRTASFKLKGFSNVELEQWKRRTGVTQIIRITHTKTRVRVVYK